LVNAMGSATYSASKGTGTTGDYAARLCDIHEAGGYNDWFLPSNHELNEMYNRLKAQGLGSFSDNYYWSSSEYNALYAWSQIFYNGHLYNYSRNYSGRVRPVRAF